MTTQKGHTPKPKANLMKASNGSREMRDLSRTDPEELLAKATTLIEGRKLAQATKLLERLLTADPSAEANYLLGVALFRNGEFPRAAQQFEKVVKENDQHLNGHYYLGLTYERQGSLDEALAQYRRAIQISPSFSLARDKLRALAGDSEAESRKESANVQTIVGVVESAQLRSDAVGILAPYMAALQRRTQSILTIRLVREDGSLTSIALTGTRIIGSIPERGDRLEVEPSWKDGRIEVTRVKNLSTGEFVSAAQPSPILRAARVGLIGFAALWIVFIFSFVIRGFFFESSAKPLPHAKLTLSPTSGPPGTMVQIKGAGFQPGENVEIIFHAQKIGDVEADDNGTFTLRDARIPDDWQFTGSFQIAAHGEQSGASVDEAFRVTQQD